MRHPRLLDVAVMGAIAAVAGNCQIPELCVPQTGTVGFFSKGDCAFTKASSFRGHEWLTFLGNRDLPEDRRFADEEIADVIEGNRRVDWPKELLVQLAHSIVAYIQAATELQDRPENQPVHFLLNATNDSRDAAARGSDVIRDRTRRAVAEWTSNRLSALTRIGEACHTVQDSFSAAHTVRDQVSKTVPWCIKSVKSYATRAPGYELPGDQYHGGKSGDAIGHTTTLDSIYRAGRDCSDPETTEHVESCLSEEARRGRLATRDYLAVVLDLVRRSASEAEVDRSLEPFFAAHTALCP